MAGFLKTSVFLQCEYEENTWKDSLKRKENVQFVRSIAMKNTFAHKLQKCKKKCDVWQGFTIAKTLTKSKTRALRMGEAAGRKFFVLCVKLFR